METALKSFTLLLTVTLIIVMASGVTADVTCDQCGKSISGEYIQFNGHSYHPTCYRQYIAPRCAVCGQPVDENWVTFEGKAYHETCYTSKIALRCSVCGEIIEGEYKYDHWGNMYHPWHQQEIASCAFCGRLLSDPVAGGGREFDDEKYICLHCDQQAIKDQAEAEALLNQIRDYLASEGIVIRNNNITFHLASQKQLTRFMGQDRQNQFGLTKYEQSSFFGLFNERTFEIYILEGMPRMHFVLTAGHELMHVWQYLYAPEDGNQALVEGSCNYAGLLAMSEFDNEMIEYVKLQLENEPDKVYGDGFRRVQEMVSNRGIKYWLEHLRFDPEFPIGY